MVAPWGCEVSNWNKTIQSDAFKALSERPMTTTDPKLIERIANADPVADWLQECTDGRVSSHTVTMLNSFRRWYDEYRVAAAINEAAQKERAGIVAWLKAGAGQNTQNMSRSLRVLYLKGLHSYADAIERGEHLPSPPAIEAKESQHG